MVSGISPGAIRTPMNLIAWKRPEAHAELMQLIPYKRIGEPEHIGRPVRGWSPTTRISSLAPRLFVDRGKTLYPGFAENS